MEKTDQKRKICMNCKYLIWAVGVGQGLKCSRVRKDDRYEAIPHRDHTCELFEFKEEIKIT